MKILFFVLFFQISFYLSAEKNDFSIATAGLTKKGNTLWALVSMKKLKNNLSPELPFNENIDKLIKKIIKKTNKQLALYADGDLYSISGIMFKKRLNSWIISISYSQRKYLATSTGSRSLVGNFTFHYYADGEPMEIEKVKASPIILDQAEQRKNFLEKTLSKKQNKKHYRFHQYIFSITRNEITQTPSWDPFQDKLPISQFGKFQNIKTELSKYVTKTDIGNGKKNLRNFAITGICIKRFYETSYWYILIYFSNKSDPKFYSIGIPILFSKKIIVGEKIGD